MDEKAPRQTEERSRTDDSASGGVSEPGRDLRREPAEGSPSGADARGKSGEASSCADTLGARESASAEGGSARDAASSAYREPPEPEETPARAEGDWVQAPAKKEGAAFEDAEDAAVPSAASSNPGSPHRDVSRESSRGTFFEREGGHSDAPRAAPGFDGDGGRRSGEATGASTDERHEESRHERPHREESEAAREASRQRRRLESTLRDVMRRAIERGVDAGLGAIEQSVDVLERSVEVGRGSVKSTSSRLRDVIEDVRIPRELPKEFASLPKDVVNMLVTQLDEGKSILIGAVAKEVREFLDETDIAYELQRVLTSLSFEISTEIRFVPNERGMPRAEVSAKARPKVSSRRAKKRRRDSEEDE